MHGSKLTWLSTEYSPIPRHWIQAFLKRLYSQGCNRYPSVIRLQLQPSDSQGPQEPRAGSISSFSLFKKTSQLQQTSKNLKKTILEKFMHSKAFLNNKSVPCFFIEVPYLALERVHENGSMIMRPKENYQVLKTFAQCSASAPPNWAPLQHPLQTSFPKVIRVNKIENKN